MSVMRYAVVSADVWEIAPQPTVTIGSDGDAMPSISSGVRRAQGPLPRNAHGRGRFAHSSPWPSHPWATVRVPDLGLARQSLAHCDRETLPSGHLALARRPIAG